MKVGKAVEARGVKNETRFLLTRCAAKFEHDIVASAVDGAASAVAYRGHVSTLLSGSHSADASERLP